MLGGGLYATRQQREKPHFFPRHSLLTWRHGLFLHKLARAFPLIYINLPPRVTPKVAAGNMNNQRYL
ncbi:hypothetical protein UUU_23170 [Klebsiella pneumoniae subsp. pneumoniae DSM 30104 = JCM 1662 = NBRC 14940]|nr:hypothetical protein UUU_23170 [Klebsiella pneumoniae subsp. pneumoniae DSM 30104 = JCM 1662 = NBRC 14940]